METLFTTIENRATNVADQPVTPPAAEKPQRVAARTVSDLISFLEIFEMDFGNTTPRIHPGQVSGFERIVKSSGGDITSQHVRKMLRYLCERDCRTASKVMAMALNDFADILELSA